MNTIAEDGCEGHEEALMKFMPVYAPAIRPTWIKPNFCLKKSSMISIVIVWGRWAISTESQFGLSVKEDLMSLRARIFFIR